MGNKVSSPFLVTFAKASGRLGPANLAQLECEFKLLLSPSASVVSEVDFIRATRPLFGPAGELIASRLFRLVADGEAALSFEKYAVAAHVFQQATPADELNLLFSCFDSKQAGALSREDLRDLLLVVTTAGSFFAADIAGTTDGTTRAADAADAPPVPRPLDNLSSMGAAPPRPLSPERILGSNPLVDLMCETALYRFASCADGRLSSAQWSQFAAWEPNVGRFARRLSAFMTKAILEEKPHQPVTTNAAPVPAAAGS